MDILQFLGLFENLTFDKSDFPIRFGTSGWRGILAREVTLSKVVTLANAIAVYLSLGDPEARRVVRLGYDTRFFSRLFAELIACTLVRSGVSVDFEAYPITTPALSFATIQGKYDLGINVTASHNPFYYHGVKLTTRTGLADGSLTGQIEALCDKSTVVPKPIENEGMLRSVSAKEDYVEHLCSLLDVQAIYKANPFVVYDSLYGASARCFGSLLNKVGAVAFPLHAQPDPYFGGLDETAPSPRALRDLAYEVRQRGALLGLATDGDGDRFGVMDDQGVYVDNTDLIALIVDYLLRVRGERGAVVKSVSTSSMVDRIARAFGVEVIESPVGFKNIASRMVQSSGLLGVEESGGFAYSPNIPDKDGLLTDMFALEMRVKEGPFHEQLLRLRSRYGELTFQRLDIPIAEARSEKAFRLAIESLPSAFQGASMLHDSSLDGYKRYFEDDSWILIRPSGTENKIRLYFESASLDVFRAMLAWAEGLKELFQSQTK